jgi:hypothetical protein
MFAQQNILKKTFDKYGWELVENQIPDDRWTAEIWLIKSIWSPINCYAFLSFVVDPHFHNISRLQNTATRNENVWSIGISSMQPPTWRNDDFDIDASDDFYEEIFINRKWEKRVPEFFEALAKLRARYNKLRQ